MTMNIKVIGTDRYITACGIEPEAFVCPVSRAWFVRTMPYHVMIKEKAMPMKSAMINHVFFIRGDNLSVRAVREM